MLVLARLGLLLCVHAGPVAADPFDLYAEKLEQADVATRDGDLTAAVERYGEAYLALPEEERVAQLGTDVLDRILELVTAARARDTADLALYRAARATLARHLEDTELLAPDRDPAAYRQALADLDGVLEQLEPPPPEPAEPPTAREPPPAPAPPPPAPSAPSPSPASHRSLALGLTASGAVLAATGAALLGWGGWYYRDTTQTFDAVHDRCLNRACREAFADWRDQEHRKGAGWLVGGSVAAVAGLSMLIAGSVSLARDHGSARARRPTVLPVAGRWSGLALRGEF